MHARRAASFAQGESTDLRDLVDRPERVEHLDTPTVLVDEQRLERNLDRAAGRAADAGLALAPHLKTHKSRSLARRQLARGAAGLTVAKLDELGPMLDLGAGHLLLAYPVVSPVKAERLASFVSRTDSEIRMGLDSSTGAEALSSAAVRAGVTLPVLIEVDSGLGRCGVEPQDAGALARIAETLPGLVVRGVFTHAGHGYTATSPEHLERIAAEEANAVRRAAAALSAEGSTPEVISVGSTPTFFAEADRRGLTEVRPGNYVFFDRVQAALGVATLADCSLSVLCTVVSTRPGSAVVDAGSKVFGLDRGAHGTSSVTGFGVDLERGVELAWLSEEHGVIDDPDGALRIGDRLRFVPNHACVTANLARELVLVRGDRVVDVLTVDAPGGGR